MDSIPHVIHQIWIGPDPEPTMWTDTFRKDYLSANPDFSYKLWNNDNINELFTDFPIYKKVYDIEKTWNGKSDILRYLILYLYGGIYIDADSVWLGRSMNDLLNCKIFAGIEPNTNVITGGVIGSVKGNKLFLDIIKHIENYIISNGNIKYCSDCAKEIKKEQDRIADKKYRDKIKNEKAEKPLNPTPTMV